MPGHATSLRDTRAGVHRKAAAALSAKDTAAMEAMAADWRTVPEILFVLSQASSPRTRTRVAGNPSTPDAANELLLHDDVAEVRAELGRKIAASLPELSGPEADRLRDAATAKLLVLARDRDAVVRRRLSSALAHLDCVPKDVITVLARDLDDLVSVPIVEFSPLLDDGDLIALIAETPSALSLSAIARRGDLAPDVVDRLVDTGNTLAMTTLLRNSSTHLRESTLDRLTDRAVAIEELQMPLVGRPELTERLVVKLSSFVAKALVAELAKRNGLSNEARQSLQARLDAAGNAEADPGKDAGAPPDETAIVKAAGDHSEAGVVAALAARADIPESAVRRVFAMRMAKAIVALAWKAGLSMEAAMHLQTFPGRVPQSRRVAPGRDGGYPMGEEELEWHLSALGIGTGTPSAAE